MLAYKELKSWESNQNFTGDLKVTVCDKDNNNKRKDIGSSRYEGKFEWIYYFTED